MTNQDGHTRRDILRAAFAGAAGLALVTAGSRAAWAAQGLHAAADERLADDLYILRLPGEANVVAYIRTDGIVLVDGVSATGADALVTAVSRLAPNRPIRTVFNTHWHPEQTGANGRLAAAGATIVAHENTRLWLGTDVTWPWDGRQFRRLPAAAQPTSSFYTAATLDGLSPRPASATPQSATLSPAYKVQSGSAIRYGYIPDAAHTDGDLYVHFPQQNVLAVGDAVCGAGWPVVDWATGGWIGGIVGGLQRLQTLADPQTRIVPARGPVLTLADLTAQSVMYETLYDRLSQMLNKGRGPDEAVAAKPAAEFEARMGNADEFVRRAFESLWAYVTPDA